MSLRDNILDGRFRGMVIKLVLSNGEVVEGVVDDVARYELSLRVKEFLYVVFRHGISYLEVNASELHGERREELEDTIITNELVGSDVELVLTSGARIRGRLMKISRYELGIRYDDKGLIIPKSSILYVKLSSI